MADEEVKEVKDKTPVEELLPEIKEIKPEWKDRKDWELNTRINIRQEYEQLLEIWKAKDLKEIEDKQNEIIKENILKLYEKIKEEQKPPSPVDIQQLLDQDYETFTLKVQVEDGEHEGGEAKFVTEMFTIRELPQAAEIKFYTQFKDKILNKASDLQAFTQEAIDMPFEQKVKSIMTVFGESFDMLAETTVIVLNSTGKRKVRGKVIDREWVQANVSSDRQWNIVEAQMKVNRVKDFFSKLSDSSQQTQTMMTGVNFQQLQQLAR